MTKDDYYYKVAYLGIPGSYSYAAANKFFKKNMILISCKSIAEVFKKVTDQVCRFGIVPLENSINGNILETFDLFIKNKILIIGEIVLGIHQCLLGNGKIDIRGIKFCYSHPQAISQCSLFLKKYPWIKARSVNDTATAAKLVANSRKKESAAIAGQKAAKIYGLTLIKKNIENDKNNSTRFVVFSKGKDIKLKNLRKIIDLLDEQLLEILGRRFKLLSEITKEKRLHKLNIEDKRREKEVIDRLKKESEKIKLSTEFIEKIFGEIIKESKRLQGFNS